MGNCGNAPGGGLVITENPITLPKYKSEVETLYEEFDKKYNFLKDISLFDFLISIQNLKFTKTPGTNDYITEEDPETIFLSFIEPTEVETFLDNTIGKHPRHYNEKDSQNKQLFTEYFQKLIDYNLKGQKDYYKNHEMNDEYNKEFKKYMLIQLGLLFCFSKDMEKINVFFSSVVDENGKVSQNQNFELFVYMLIFTASFSNFSTVYKLQQENDGKLPTLKLEEREKWDDYFGLYQVQNAFASFKTELFGQENKEYTYEQFFSLIQKENLAWILSLQGIRMKCAQFKKDPLQVKQEREQNNA